MILESKIYTHTYGRVNLNFTYEHIDFPFLVGTEKHKIVLSWKLKFSGTKFVLYLLIMHILKVDGDLKYINKEYVLTRTNATSNKRVRLLQYIEK